MKKEIEKIIDGLIGEKTGDIIGFRFLNNYNVVYDLYWKYSKEENLWVVSTEKDFDNSTAIIWTFNGEIYKTIHNVYQELKKCECP